MDFLGYAASFAVLATFLTRTMKPLRLIAIISNILFLTYGYAEHIYPVFLLHVVLLPVNTWRLFVLQRGQETQPTAMRPAHAPAFGSTSLAPWLAIGLLAGLLGPFTIFTAMAAPNGVRGLATHLVVECRSTASSLAVRLAGKTEDKAYGKTRGLNVLDRAPDEQLVHASAYRA